MILCVRMLSRLPLARQPELTGALPGSVEFVAVHRAEPHEGQLDLRLGAEEAAVGQQSLDELAAAQRPRRLRLV